MPRGRTREQMAAMRARKAALKAAEAATAGDALAEAGISPLGGRTAGAGGDFELGRDGLPVVELDEKGVIVDGSLDWAYLLRNQAEAEGWDKARRALELQRALAWVKVRDAGAGAAFEFLEEGATPPPAARPEKSLLENLEPPSALDPVPSAALPASPDVVPAPPSLVRWCQRCGDRVEGYPAKVEHARLHPGWDEHESCRWSTTSLAFKSPETKVSMPALRPGITAVICRICRKRVRGGTAEALSLAMGAHGCRPAGWEALS